MAKEVSVEWKITRQNYDKVQKYKQTRDETDAAQNFEIQDRIYLVKNRQLVHLRRSIKA